MATLWRNALLITMGDDARSTPLRADLLIDDDTIAAIGPDLKAPAGTTVIDGRDLLIYPGLINAHTHSWEVLFRGTSDRLPLELWMLTSYPPVGLPPVSPRLAYLRTQVAGIEALHGGTTTVLDDIGELPVQSAGTLAAVFDAYDDIGLRATCTGGVADVPLVDRLPHAGDVFPACVLERSRAAMPDGAAIVRDFIDFSADAFRHFHKRSPRLRYAVGPSAPQRSSDELLLASAALAEAHDAVLHTHLLETRLQAVLAEQRYGTTAVEHLRQLGVLTGNVTLAHAIWLTPSDIETIASSGASAVHNPLSNQKLGSGLFPWRAMHAAGAVVALGSDGASSSDSLRMLEVVKAAALLHTLGTPQYTDWPAVDEVLWAATRGGAEAVGQAGDIGQLTVGAQADLVVIDLTATTSFTPLNDAARQLVYSEDGRSIHQVWVAGELLLEDGVILSIDERAVLAEFREEAARYLAGTADWAPANARFAPFVADTYARVWAQPKASN